MNNRASNRGPRKSNKAIADDTRRESTVIHELYRVLHLIIPTGFKSRWHTHPVDRTVMPITDQPSDRYRYREIER